MHSSHLKRAGSAVLAFALALAGCSGDTKTETVTVAAPRVDVTGEYVVLVTSTAQLTATTSGATDASYTWASSNTAVATVSGAGLVRGLSAGKAAITATGVTSGKVGTYNILVSNDIPHQAEWQASKHAALATEPFQHWGAPGSGSTVPTTCAKCHSGAGYVDFLQDAVADANFVGTVNVAPPVGGVIGCSACHSEAATQLTGVRFPSGAVVRDLGPEARCMTCHQGLEATDTVNAQIDGSGLPTVAVGVVDPDVMSTTKLGFKNIHYFAAGATLEANRARGGYQYKGKVYDARFRHVPGFDSCVGCHDPHTLEVRVDECAKCHTNVTGADYAAKLATLRDIRMQSSLFTDYDNDGNTTEGISKEIDGLRAKLQTAMTAYVAATAGLNPICYSAAAYPYFFKDTDASGFACDASEAVFANSYKTWTPRLERAAYNYQVSIKDPGAFAHNAKYILELLTDSVQDLVAAPGVVDPVYAASLARTEKGHFNGAGEPARHWDANDAVDASCSKCHGGSDGFTFFLTYGVGNKVEQDNGLDCATCHAAFQPFPTASAPQLRSVTSVTFPSTKVVKADSTTGNSKLNSAKGTFVCMTCHQGREAKVTVDANITAAGVSLPAAIDPDAVNTFISFKNVHYLAAGASLLGSEAGVAYEYGANVYVGRKSHGSASYGINCIDCHATSNHSFSVADKFTSCATACHSGQATVADLRNPGATVDYDGNGTVETLEEELAAIRAETLVNMQTYATAHGGGICYDGATYPYYMKHPGNTGACLVSEAKSSNSYKNWTAKLARAAFNLQFFTKDPGAWAHNMKYATEVLYDTIVDLGGTPTFPRP